MTAPDLVLIAYILLLVPAMLVGFGFARRKLFVPHHKLTMTTITIVNWLLIGFVMAVTYDRDIAPQLPQNLKFSEVFIPTLHLLTGLTAQLIATYLVIRMWFEKQLPEFVKVKNIKIYMRTTLALWLVTALLGLTTWAVLHHDFLSSPPPPTIATTNANPAVPVIQMVSGDMFSMKDLTIPAGTTVHFVNADTKSHTVTADDNSFDSGKLLPGKSFDHTFNQPGDVKYYCTFHGDVGGVGMSAVIHVTGKAVGPAATAVATLAATSSAATPAATSKQAATQEATGVPGLAATAEVTVPATRSATQSATTAASGAAQSVTIALTDDMFMPTTITVAAGTTVHFVNNGKHRHTVTADDGSFDSGQISGGASFDHTFSKVGDVPLYCANHGDTGGVGMSMVVHVTAAGQAPASTPGALAATQEATKAASSAALASTQEATKAVPTTSLASTQEATKAAANAVSTPSETMSAAVVSAMKPLVISASDTPNKVAYLVGLKTQTALIDAQAALIRDALKQGHIEDAQAAAEAITNIINNGPGTDLDKNGTINQPGDGFGVTNYIYSVNETISSGRSAAGISVSQLTLLITMQRNGPTNLKDLQDITTQTAALLAANSLVDARNIEPALSAAVATLDTAVASLVQAGVTLNVPGSTLTTP